MRQSTLPVVLPIFSRAVLPALAAFAGLSFLSVAPSIASIPDGGCALFSGVSVGNDPSQVVELELCRVGRAVFGEKASAGDAGGTVYEVSGTITGPGTMVLETSRVLKDAPAEGWVSCADDVIDLTWSASDAMFIGSYVSAECNDRASLALTRIESSRYSGLTSSERDPSAWLAALDASRATPAVVRTFKCGKRASF